MAAPHANPAHTIPSASPIISQLTSLALAPSAIRTPISLVRRATV
jgi:hypothetical protein